jgi:GntR family transcriptional regulator, transcriptional repressor for pyruvate dehydrogenase complex
VAGIGGSSTPVGSRRAADALRGAGIAVSESTVSRLLRRLDGQKLTEAQDAKGRILTDEGRRLLLTLNERDRRDQILRHASGVSDITDLLDLLYARRGVEREAARAAARRATDADIARLRELVADHQARIDERRIIRHGALTFHQVIGEMANNRLLSAMMEVLFEPVMDQTEAILDVIIGSHHSEQQSVEEHLEIMQAIVARDPERADAAMAAHLGRLIDETEAFAAGHQGDLVERMLTWMHDGQSPPGRRPAG